MQRVKDVERFLADLERPLAPAPGTARVVSEAELEQDGANFMAFAKAMGIAPPRPRSPATPDAVVTSAPAS